MKNYFLICLFVIGTYTAFSQNKPNPSQAATPPTAAVFQVAPITGAVKMNVQKEHVFKVPVQTETQINNAINSTTQSLMRTTYSDGFGRTQQSILRKVNPVSKDLLQAQVYVNDGKTSYELLPIPTLTSGEGIVRDVQAALRNAYNNLGYTQENYLYSKQVRETSPIGRPLEVYAPGNSWVGNDKAQNTQSSYLNNQQIPKFELGQLVSSVPVYVGVYDKVLEVRNTDEDNNAEQISYYNLLGQLVCEKVQSGSNQLTTCYVYDDYNQLRYTIPPKAIEAMVAAGNVLSNEVINKLCFRNDYDEYGRLIGSKKPEIGITWVVYDKQDRPVLTQDAVQRQNNQWIFTKYDGIGRVIQTGIFVGAFVASENTSVPQDDGTVSLYATGATVPYTRALLQNIINTGTISNTFLNYLLLTEVSEYSQYQIFTGAEVMLTNIYDQYDQVPFMPFSTNLAQRTEGYFTEKSSKIRGLLTATIAAISDGSTTPVRTVYYYNKREEMIQRAVRGTNNSLRFFAMGYDFNGRTVKSILRHTQLEVSRKFSYDTYDRLTKIEHKINNNNNYRPIARYYYDDLGRMSTRKLGGMGYNVNYEYNIRNWISGINKNFALTKNNTDYFGMEISYEKGFDQTYLNGRIAGIKWRNKGTSGEQRSYGYLYDFAGRLTLGDYYQLSENIPTTWSKTEKDFTTSNLSYDANGNILSMKHMGLNNAKQIIVLDDLVYTYASNSNLLLGVAESASSQSADPQVHDGLPDFRNVGNIGSTDYGYDANGNKQSDANKGISQINNKWFGLNKPLLVEFSNNNKIEYVYDATGSLLSKKITQAGTNTITRYDYVDEVTYKNGNLEGLTHEEGRIRVNAHDNTCAYDYFIKDYLQNVRSIITETQVNVWGGETNIDEITWPTALSPTTPVYNDGGVVIENGFIVGGDGCAEGPVLYLATSEVQNDTLEELFFDNLDETRANKLLDAETNDLKAANLNPSEGKIIGPGILLKVMAGDRLQLGMEALYFNSTTPGAPTPLVSIVSSLVSALGGSGGLIDGIGAANLGSNLDPAGVAAAISQMQSGTQDTTKPKAYLNYLMFDESMQVITEESGALQVQQANAWGDLSKPLFDINRNGYIYVYSLNASGISVRTDNLFVAHYQGSLLEEFHYYPFGLCFEVSRSPLLGKAAEQKYNSQFIQQDEFEDANGQTYGLEDYDFAFRNYDPQIGRWLQPDPLMQHASPYLAMSNNPVMFTDPTGLWDGESNAEDDKPKVGEVRYSSNGTPYVYTEFGGYEPQREVLIQADRIPWWFEQFGFFSSNDGYVQVNSEVPDGSGNQTSDGRAYNIFNYQENTRNWAKHCKSPSGLPDWMGKVNTGINTFGIGNGMKVEVISYAIRQNYKSARSYSAFNKLSQSQQSWRITNTLGKTGAQYLKYSKGLGVFGAGLSTTYSTVNAGVYYYNGGTDWKVGVKATMDIVMTGVGFVGPIGFGVSAAYFILDNSTKNFGGFGTIKP